MERYPTTEQLELWEFENYWQYAYIKGRGLPGKLTILRQKLYQKAKQEPRFRFYALYDRIWRWDVLNCAYEIVRSKKGAAGVDGVSFDDIEANLLGIEGFLKDIQDSLRNKTYKPDAVRRVYIPKPDGRQRPLGIPTIRDRVVQMATLLILEPIFEADFLNCSYGFRPGFTAWHALEDVRMNLQAGRTAVFDADLRGYFDSIPHDKLEKCLRMRISDGATLKLIRMWLRAPVVEKEPNGRRKVTRSKQGTPQGGVISPLLANVYLHWFDKVFCNPKGPINWANARIVRYADDFVILARYQGQRLQEFIEAKLETWLGLELNRDKTKVVNLVNPGESFTFLGYTFRFDRSQFDHSKRYLNITPSKKAIAAEREALRQLINSRRNHVALPKMIDQVNRQLKGWANYFRYGYPRVAFRSINGFVIKRLTQHVKRRSQRAFKPPEGVSYYRHLHRLGLIDL